MQTTQPPGYSRLQIALHWAIAALVLFNYLFGETMEEAYDAVYEEAGAASGIGYQLHVWVGLAVLALVLLRLGLRLTAGVIPAVTAGPALLDRGAAVAHGLLYLLMVAVPALGATAWFLGVEEAADLHGAAVNMLMLLAGLHAAAALFHQFVLKDHLLRRMMRAR